MTTIISPKAQRPIDTIANMIGGASSTSESCGRPWPGWNLIKRSQQFSVRSWRSWFLNPSLNLCPLIEVCWFFYWKYRWWLVKQININSLILSKRQVLWSPNLTLHKTPPPPCRLTPLVISSSTLCIRFSLLIHIWFGFTLSASIELVSSSARVTSANFQQGLVKTNTQHS